MIIAIDGPAGSGKSSVAKQVAQQLGFAYLDTGAMYRAVAWQALQEGLDLSDPLPLATQERITAIAASQPIEFAYLPGEPLPSQVMIGGVDVTSQIRTPATDVAVSPVSAHAGVRQALTQQQRVIGASRDTVMEGRDIGTVVFPDAQLKVFLTATPAERAHRRYCQNRAKAHQCGQEYTGPSKAQILADIQRRDAYDSPRAAAPLKPAADSVELDTTNMDIAAVVAQIVAWARERQAL